MAATRCAGVAAAQRQPAYRQPSASSRHIKRSRRILAGSEIAFSIELAVCNAGYEVDGALFLKHHIPGEYLFRNTLAVFAKPGDDGRWRLRYAWADDQWPGGPKAQAESDLAGTQATGNAGPSATVFSIPLTSAKGFAAELKLALSTWA